MPGLAKYIEREALIAWLKHIPLRDLSDGRGLCRVIMEDDFKKAIKEMPKGIITDVAPVQHGRWVKRGCKWQCTHCKVLMSIDGTPKENLLNYCPNCGAKMDLEV